MQNIQTSIIYNSLHKSYTMKIAIPSQKKGNHNDTVSERLFSTEKQAKLYFRIVRQRLLAINDWHKIAGEEKAEFALANKEGLLVKRLPIMGDYFRINLPGPDNQSGEGFDWVRVEDIHEDDKLHEEFVFIKVRPSSNPQNNNTETAHFFDNAATSTFIVKRDGNKLSAEVHTRNEKPNIKGLNLAEKIRNTFVALGGIFGASKIQWKSLTDGLLV